MLLSGEPGTGPIDHGEVSAGESDQVSAIGDEFSLAWLIATMDSIAEQLSQLIHGTLPHFC